ncbi:MAG TPA: hypothetical protein VNP95_08140 [Thermomicrobiales bacterium]|jgi:hypothetical protein|nr:hypothetical protein [Thermomicrobiales bacterium]
MSEGPKPFSSDWYTKPSEPERKRPRRHFPRAVDIVLAVGKKLPGERALGVMLVFVLVFSSMWMAGPRSDAHIDASSDVAVETPIPSGEFAAASDDGGSTSTISTDTLQVAEGNAAPAATESEQGKTAPKLELQATEPPSTANGLLPGHRILTFYGFPGNDNMGILGEYDKETALAKLKEQAAAYEAADPATPVLIAFEVIASVGQQEPMADGSYLLDAPSDLLDEYADFCEKNGILLFLDVQIGRRTVETDTHGLEKWLAKPFVHLAIDPEFAMREGQIPGEHIGQVDASDVTATQNWLVQLSQKYNIPPKVLVVHQFHDGMIENKDKIAPVPGVQLVIDADGWGPPDQKKSTYAFVNGAQQIEYDGIKLFYKQDDPIMTPEEIVDLDPVPLLVIYQ